MILPKLGHYRASVDFFNIIAHFGHLTRASADAAPTKLAIRNDPVLSAALAGCFLYESRYRRLRDARRAQA
jgi:hypothetical protein